MKAFIYLLVHISRFLYEMSPTYPSMYRLMMRIYRDLWPKQPFASLAYINAWHYYRLMVAITSQARRPLSTEYILLGRNIAKVTLDDFSIILAQHGEVVNDHRYWAVKDLIETLRSHARGISALEAIDPTMLQPNTLKAAAELNRELCERWGRSSNNLALDPRQYMYLRPFRRLLKQTARYYGWNYGIFGHAIKWVAADVKR